MNIPLISLKLLVLKLDKFKEIIDEHSENIKFISFN